MKLEKQAPTVVHTDDIPEKERLIGEHWGAAFKSLTPSMRPGGGTLGVNMIRVPPGRTAVPFHTHQREDEAFYILSGKGVLRYGDDLFDLRPGHCISCPRATQIAHQIANPSDSEDLVYLAIGPRDEDEVCTYPDTGKVLVRSLNKIGRMSQTEYMDGEPDHPKILDLNSDRKPTKS